MEESGTPIENSQVEGGQGENTSTGGIGGGLIVALICVIVVHLYSLISLSTFISRFSYFPLFNTFMIIHVLILMALSALAIFLFFTKKKETVETIVKLYTLFVVVESINLVKLIFYFGRTTTWLMTALSASLGLAIAWIIYFRKSPRPQATFTNETTEPFLKDVVEILSKIKIGKILGVPEMTGSSTTVVDAAAQPAIQPLSTEEAPTPKPAAPPVPRPPKELKGLGGWLIVPAILIFLYPLLHLFNMVLISMRMRNTGLVQGLITLAIFGLIIGLAVITAIKFFTKKEDAPKFVVLNLFAFPVLLLIDNIRTAIWGYIDISFFAIAINLAAAPIFFKFYFKKSKRAEKTFVNPAGGMSKVLRGGFIAIIVLYAVSTVTLNILDEKARNNLAAAIKTDNTELLSLPLFLGLEKERRGILTEALTKNSWKVAKKLVEAGVDPNSGSRGSSALNFAIGAKDKDFIKLLIDKGARVDETVLISAIRTGDPELLNDLVKQGNITDKRILNNLLVFSVNSGQIGTAKYLMSKGAEPKKSTKTYGFDYEGKIQELLGSEESAGDTELLNNLLTTAVGKNHIEVAEFLIEKGADYKIKIGVREETLLHKAAESGAVKQAEYFLNKGLSFNTPDKTALSPLDVAVNRNRPEVVQLFMNNGAKLKPVQSSRLLFASVEKGDIKTLEFLIEKGVNISAQHEQSRMTPLHYAASKGNLEIAKILLDKKANVNAPDQRGRTPLFNAIEKWKTHMVKLLLEKGASVDVKSTWKRTPMDEANRIPIEEHKKAIIALLNGAKK